MKKNLQFFLKIENKKGASIFEALGASVMVCPRKPSWADSTDLDTYYYMLLVELTPDLQESLSIKTSGDVTGFIKFFDCGSPRREAVADRAIARNAEKWEALKETINKILSQITNN